MLVRPAGPVQERAVSEAGRSGAGPAAGALSPVVRRIQTGHALARSPTAAADPGLSAPPSRRPWPDTHLGVGQQLLPLGLQRSRGIGGHILQRLLAGLVGAGGDSAHVDGHCRAEAREGADMVVGVCRKLGSRPQGSCRVPGERRSAQLRPLPPAQAPLGPAAHRCAGGGGRSWWACRRAGRARTSRQAVCVQAANGRERAEPEQAPETIAAQSTGVSWHGRPGSRGGRRAGAQGLTGPQSDGRRRWQAWLRGRQVT